MSKKQITQLVAIGVGLIIFAATLMGSFKKTPAKKIAPVGKTPKLAAKENKAVSPPSATEMKQGGKKISLQKQHAEQPWGRDPFRMSAAKDQQKTELVLKGISFGANKRGFAFINNDIVKAGDKLGDYEIIAIEKDKVLVQKRDGQTFYLALPRD